MVTVIIKRNAEPTVIQLTQENIMRELQSMNNSEMLLEDSWATGLKKVRTPYVCLVEADCILNSGYLFSSVSVMMSDNHNPIKRTGGYLKRAMLSSPVGIKSFSKRIYNYETMSGRIEPNYDVRSISPYHVQIGFVPGAIIRMTAIKDIINKFDWNEPDLVRLSTKLSFYLWNSNRRVQVNPTNIYVSNESGLENPNFSYHCPRKVMSIFEGQRI